ncbi:unnamed protein product [Calypogeia fissa]
MASMAGSTRSSTDIMTNLSHLLPTGTFLAFQSLAPLFTNNGDCKTPERIVTGILLLFFFVGCFGLSFIDSVTTDTGKVFYGIVTPKGLYNEQFKKAPIPGDLIADDSFFTGGDDSDDYKLKFSDFTNGVLNIVAFGALSLLTPPITTCYYPNVPTTVVKTAPILAAFVVGVLFAGFPSGRHGIGHTRTTSGYGFVPETSPPSTQTKAPNTADSSTDQLLLMNGSTDTVVEMQQKGANKV